MGSFLGHLPRYDFQVFSVACHFPPCLFYACDLFYLFLLDLEIGTDTLSFPY